MTERHGAATTGTQRTTWEAAWQVLAAVRAPLPQRQVAAVDDELDFLAPPETQAEPELTPLVRAGAGSPRAGAVAGLDLPALVQEFTQAWPELQRRPELAELDGEAALALCRLLAMADGLHATEHGPAVVLLRRAVASADAELATAAAAAIARLAVREAQVDVAERLRHEPARLGHAGVEALLSCLDRVADGRSVRALEALLLERSGELAEAHAWRARHIVQRIRRAGRK